MTCPCNGKGATQVTRRLMAGHIAEAHGVNNVRAMLLAHKLEERVELGPEDLAVLGAPLPESTVRRPSSNGGGLSKTSKAFDDDVVRSRGLPDDAALNRVIAGSKVNEPKPMPKPMSESRPRKKPAAAAKPTGRCERCKERPAVKNGLCRECGSEVGASAPRLPVPAAPVPAEMPQPSAPVAAAEIPSETPPRPVRKRRRDKDPEACLLCKRFAPDKCSHHGGPRRTTAFGGRTLVERTRLRIAILQERIERGRRAQAELDELRAALRPSS